MDTHTQTRKRTFRAASVHRPDENKLLHINHIYPLLFLSWPSLIPPFTLSSVLPCSEHLSFLSSVPPFPLIHPFNQAYICHVFILWWKDPLADSCQSESSGKLPIIAYTRRPDVTGGGLWSSLMCCQSGEVHDCLSLLRTSAVTSRIKCSQLSNDDFKLLWTSVVNTSIVPGIIMDRQKAAESLSIFECE